MWWYITGRINEVKKMKENQKIFLLTLLRLVRDGKIRYNRLYFSKSLTRLELEELIKDLEVNRDETERN
jgi:hypothetical protein